MKIERSRWLGLWVVTVAVAGWLGSELAGRGGERGASEGRVAVRGDVVPRGAAWPGPGVARGLDADELRALVREELARAEERRGGAAAMPPTAAADLESEDSGAHPGQVPAGPPPPSPEEKAQRVSDALAVVEDAVASGQWRGEERQRFMAAAARLPAAELFEVTRQLNIAINRGQIAISDGLPPYGPAALMR